MKRVVIFIAVAAFTALFAHKLTLHAIPKLIMGEVMAQMQERGVPFHRFVFSPRNTPQTQTVVRPSPDLAYSICRYNLLEDSEVSISVGPWESVGSVSFFDDRTNNFATIRLHPDQDTKITLTPGQAENSAQDHSQFIVSPSNRGIVLIRRLAPSHADYQKAEVLAASDRCGAN